MIDIRPIKDLRDTTEISKKMTPKAADDLDSIYNYIVFYLIQEEKEQVIIMRVLYGKQKYENLL